MELGWRLRERQQTNCYPLGAGPLGGAEDGSPGTGRVSQSQRFGYRGVVGYEMALSDVQRYRLRALECGQKAGVAKDPRVKADWHELERVWLDLAVRVEAEEKPRQRSVPPRSH